MVLPVTQIVKQGLSFVFPSQLDQQSAKLILITAIGTYALMQLAHKWGKRWNDSWGTHIGRILLTLPPIREKYEKDILKDRLHFQQATIEAWKEYESLIKKFSAQKIPEKGCKAKDVIQFLRDCCKVTEEKLKGKQFSGTLYRQEQSLSEQEQSFAESMKAFEKYDFTNAATIDFDQLSVCLHKLSTQIFDLLQLYNSLHFSEFPIGSWLDFQAISMISQLLGAKPNQYIGTMTDGGTGSLLLAMFAYTQRGLELKNIAPGEGIVIASKTVHAAVDKASQAFHFKIDYIDTDENGVMDLKQLEEKMKKHKNRLLVTVLSVPYYSIGQIDQIEEVAKIADKAGCKIHLDYCLGSFNVPFYEKRNTRFLHLPQIGSFSFDPHKYGLTEKEVSTVGAIEEVARHMIFTVPGWSGGTYATIGFPGSKSCRKAASAVANMLILGEEGYQCMAHLIHKKTQELADVIRDLPGKIKLLGKEQICMVAFKIDPALGLAKGATYALAYYMQHHGIILNAIQGDTVHFCVTLRFAANPKAIEQFKIALKKSLESVMQIDAKIKAIQTQGSYILEKLDKSLQITLNSIKTRQDDMKRIDMEINPDLNLVAIVTNRSSLLTQVKDILTYLDIIEAESPKATFKDYREYLGNISQLLEKFNVNVTNKSSLHEKKQILELFDKLLEQIANAIKDIQSDFKQVLKGFPGDAAMYCTLDTALNPKIKELSRINYILNFLFGQLAAIDTVKSYVLAQMNPYKIAKECAAKEEAIQLSEKK